MPNEPENQEPPVDNTGDVPPVDNTGDALHPQLIRGQGRFKQQVRPPVEPEQNEPANDSPKP